MVDDDDKVLGAAEKMEVHEKGLMHRAFSIFIFNSRKEMLLQQRALNKYHSSGLWSNACCSHPNPYEDTRLAAERRLKEEMGFWTPLQKLFDFAYKVTFENGLTENEFDHVFLGKYDGEIKMNPEEVINYSFKPMKQIKHELKEIPGIYTAWFHIAFPKIESWLEKDLLAKR